MNGVLFRVQTLHTLTFSRGVPLGHFKLQRESGKDRMWGEGGGWVH